MPSKNIPVNGWPQIKELDIAAPILAELDKIEAWQKSVKQETKSGAYVEFTNALALPAVSVSAEIVASQDLHGYDKPWVGGAGKNKCPNLKYQSSSTTIYIGQNNGTDFPFDLVANTTYTFSFNFANGFTVYLRHESESSGTNIGEASSYITFTPTLSGKYRIACYNGGGVSVDNVSNIQLEEGTAPTSYAPYENICPISGFSSVVITDVDAESHTATVTVSLGSTVYGGTLNLTTGELTVTHGYTTKTWGQYIETTALTNVKRRILGAISDAKGSASDICDSCSYKLSWVDDYAHFYIDSTNKACVVFLPTNVDDSTEINICYELAAPTTTTLTAAELEMVKGYNHISANSGNIEVTAYTGNTWN